MGLVAEGFATSAGHWYRLDGTPCYTVVGKNGKERNATLADARDVVAREWSRTQAAKMREQFYKMLAERYTVRVEADANVRRTARK